SGTALITSTVPTEPRNPHRYSVASYLAGIPLRDAEAVTKTFLPPTSRLPVAASIPPTAIVRSYRSMSVRELRLVVTAPDYEQARRFYRAVLGLPLLAEFESPGGHVVLLDAGRATLELMDGVNAAYVDEVEVGRRVAGQLRIALQVDDAAAATAAAEAAG